MFYSKEKRINFIGFDDFWLRLIGVFVLSLIMYYMFSHPSRDTSDAIFGWIISLVFSICDWSILRWIMISLRKKIPDLKDISVYATVFFLSIVGVVILVDFIGINLITYLLPTNMEYDFMDRSKPLLAIVVISTMTFSVYEAIYLYNRLSKSIREEEQSKRVMVQAQLDSLQNQAQPHFFFNTLNTLRDIIDQSPKEEAIEFVNKLSDMYRFLLENGKTKLITLKEELKFAKAYVYIQSERFGDNLKMKWDIPEESMNSLIIPMSVQVLLENAIKHNVVSRAKPLIIKVTLMNNELVVSNNMQPKSTQLPSTQLGLENIEKRFDLISGKAITIKNDGKHFEVSLPLLTTLAPMDSDEDTDY